jgi:hypothetical protein
LHGCVGPHARFVLGLRRSPELGGLVIGGVDDELARGRVVVRLQVDGAGRWGAVRRGGRAVAHGRKRWQGVAADKLSTPHPSPKFLS